MLMQLFAPRRKITYAAYPSPSMPMTRGLQEPGVSDKILTYISQNISIATPKGLKQEVG